MQQIWQGQGGELLAQLQRPEVVRDSADHRVYPSLLDACFQLVAAVNGTDPASDVVWLPFAVERLTCAGTGDQELLWCHVVRDATSTEATHTRWTITLCRADGQVIVAIEGFQTRAVPRQMLQRNRPRTDWLQTWTWQPQPILPASAPSVVRNWLLMGVATPLEIRLRTALTTADGGASLKIAALPITAEWTQIQQTVAHLSEGGAEVGVLFWGGVAIHRLPVDVVTEAHTQGSTLLTLSQVLIERGVAARLWLVTRGLHVPGQQSRSAAAVANAAIGGTLWGFMQSLAREEPRLRGVGVDLEWDQPLELVSEQILAELLAGSMLPEDQVIDGLLPIR